MSDGHRVGDVTIRRVVEHTTRIPLGFLPTATPDALARHRDWLWPWALSDDGGLLLAIQTLCLEVGGQRIVLDTCVGPRQLPDGYAWVTGDSGFLDELTAAGFGRDEVDLVVCTHLHFDHVGWNTMWENDSWVPTFRRARYLIGRAEYEHWRATPAEVRAGFNVFNLEDAVEPLFAAGQAELVEPGHRVGDVLELVSTPGHSPGHLSVRITSGGETALITGDCTHHPVQWAEPQWYSLADLDREQACDTRRRLVAEYADTGVLIIGTHFRPPGAGHLVTDGDTVRFRPLGA
ncbi:MBL fold metallo-hydrolase [Nocardia sp. alder85J]|uniref:MBL fold metallo-hydrolase n=1 Tax=Nocardia sp. alder85J TaxID=2862949 RepID=UPI001CD64E11|nr:MBL fold metallo-hydrolase [Nocardia sp. alder85J]MCX4099323.1 MBL fold metallo-hydrolase [Nocardia sp. alder85J]